MNRKFLALVLAVAMAFSLAACGQREPASSQGEGEEQQEVLRVGMECNYAPFNWTQAEQSETAVPIEGGGGYADGYDVQVAKYIAEQMGRELVIVKTEWDGLTLAVQSGKVDAIIAGMSPTEERKVSIDFSDPYYESDLVIVVKKDGPYADATSLSDFSGAKITGQLNTFHYSVIDQIEGVDKQQALENFPAMIVALQSGKIGGYVKSTSEPVFGRGIL